MQDIDLDEFRKIMARGKIVEGEMLDVFHVLAQTYAILSGLSHNDVKSCLGMRTNILMQYLPKTITYIADKFYQ